MNNRGESNVSSAIVFGLIIAGIVAIFLFLSGLSDVTTIAPTVSIAILIITLIITILTYITAVILGFNRCNTILMCFFDRGNAIAFFAFVILIIGVFILLFTATTATAILVLRILISILFGFFAALVYSFSTLIACLINRISCN